MRKVVCHYHIYKNSGSSFDAVLKRNYRDRFIAFDGPFPFFSIDQEQLGRIIERKSDIVAFSSHQTRLPVPTSLNFTVLPVIFIRNPILRAFSIYSFKRKHNDGTTTSAAARTKSFEEWVEYCFADRLEVSHISNPQTQMVGAAYGQNPLRRKESHAILYDLGQATRNLNNVELLARTEYFDRDVGRFPEILRKHGLEFEYAGISPKNVTSNNLDKPISQRVAEVEKLLSEKVFRKLMDANAQDLHLYEYVSSSIENS